MSDLSLRLAVDRGRRQGGIDAAAQLGAELGKELRSVAGPDFGLG